jgi:pimeloyl-ACP methyl ester carboxylesterase
MSAELDDFVTNVRRHTASDRVNIVAHSLGVTGARYWAATTESYEHIDTFVGIAGANHGTIAARIARYLPWNPFSNTEAFLDPVAAKRDETHPLRELNRVETPAPTHWYTLRGLYDPLFADRTESPCLDGAIENRALPVGHTDLLTDPDAHAITIGWLRPSGFNANGESV